ncbi:hypothetical protein [Rheinheimera aquimaris]|uniref:hypothetical protein n=1 Tax=Rheinheimera aquimaris TaxID=412437 RepID=UPI003A9822BD
MTLINYYLLSVAELIQIKDCKSGHLFDYWSEMTARDSAGNVHCRCARCGKNFSAPYGIALTDFGRIAPLYQYGVMYA